MSSVSPGPWNGCVPFSVFKRVAFRACWVPLKLADEPSHRSSLFAVFLSKEVPMIPQPSYAQAGSVYYICLLRDDLLLHQGKRIK